jgi:hypothetical protein
MSKPQRWDSHPKYLVYKGQTIEVFTRTALAVALNRELNSIRAMERKGILRHPRLKNYRGHWCYTRDQILDLVRLAREEGVIDPRFRKPFSERFVREAHNILKRKPL